MPKTATPRFILPYGHHPVFALGHDDLDSLEVTHGTFDRVTPYSNLYFRLPGSDVELSFRPIFRPDGEFTHFNILRGTEVVGWDWDLVGAIETADEIARGELSELARWIHRNSQRGLCYAAALEVPRGKR